MTGRSAARAVVACDLDGVVWRGDEPIDGSAAAIARLRASGFRLAFLTNNSSGTVGQYVERLARAGVDAAAEEVLTSAIAAGDLVGARLEVGARVLVCAGEGVVEAVAARGLEAVRSGPAEAVVVGWHRTFDFDEIAAASEAIRAGALFVATNTDPTFPSARGLLPGNGALVAAVATAAGARPLVAGKPEQPMADLTKARFGRTGVMVGDRPSTDGLMAQRLGWPFALVLSGIAGPGGEESVPDPRPEIVADDLAGAVPALEALLA